MSRRIIIAGSLARVSQAFGILTTAAAAYLIVLLSRYFFPPYLPRRRLESVFFFLLAFGVLTVFARPVEAPAKTERGRALSIGKAVTMFAILAAVAWATYRSVMAIGLLSDDFIVADFARRHQWAYGTDLAFARPLVPMLWAALDYAPMAFDRAVHATNIVLHAVNALLITMIAARMGMPRLQSLSAGLLFVVSPGLTEAVVWATGIHDVLMTTFVLSAIACATLADRGAQWSVAAIAATALALGAKETAVVTPALAAVVLWAAGSPVVRGRTGRTLALIFAVAVAYIVWRTTVGLPSGYAADIFRVYFVKQLIVGPFAAFGAPWTVGWAASHSTRAFVRASTLVALAAVSLLIWRAHTPAFRHAAALAAWVLIGILPVFSLFYVGPSLEGSRYLYLSSAGFALLVPVLAGTAAGALPWLFRVPGFIVALAATMLPAVPALRYEIGRWHEAARVRDIILARAATDPSVRQCDSFVVSGAIDSVDGAFVFHNGLKQALASVDRRGAEQTDGGGACRIEWNGSDLKVTH